MKKLGLFLMTAVLFATAACTGDPAAPDLQTTQPDPASMRFYGVKLPEAATRGAAQHDRLWHNGTTIRVKFLNGTPELRAKVEQYAKVWETYANITFKFVDEGDAHVRVGFDWNDNRFVTWSYIGTDCKFERDQSEATMSFAYLDYMPEDVVRGDVLRAFGQVLGLELESRNINFSPRWSPNPAMTPNYWAFNIGDVEWEILRQYVFDPLDADNAVSTDEYDPASIMRWPFPANILLNGGPMPVGGSNTELSYDDKLFVAQLYPYEEIVRTMGSVVELSVNDGYAVVVDWGNGTIEVVDMQMSWPNDIERDVKIYGSKKAISSIFIVNTTMFSSTCTHLESLRLYKAYGMGSFDIVENPLLEWLDVNGSNYITDIDLSKYPQLKRLDCYGNNLLQSLDVSNNPLIEYIECTSNGFNDNQYSLNAFANSLPDRTGNTPGYLDIADDPRIADICAAKNWVNMY